MGKKVFNLSGFSSYINVSEAKADDFHMIYFADEHEQMLSSDAVTVDFYMLSIKHVLHKNMIRKEIWDDQADTFIVINSPEDTLSWDNDQPALGYMIMLTNNYINKIGKNLSFLYYSSLDEALFLRKEEAEIVWDLYRKTFDEFKKEKFSNEIILGYISLICTYTQAFYDRQFENRSNAYSSVIANFKFQVKEYFESENVTGLPSIAYFAHKSNLSANYFGDLIKRLTGLSPLEHIQDYIIELAKKKLIDQSVSVSEVSYSLGFDYPNYFARFFRRKVGMSPTDYRKRIF
ncbi:hypothetical protein ASG22_01025 [Chryseobacterium sp. Leaf405]|uniref:helix-turn-helix domain-containing protein n=1 Tax=Chryseobacterium sp. Leaf405 TaxID=1736367 RepID=UPI0006F67582|nr:helix-turn-helix domain-containing protein [Chryseobacterium sp. Leaf405]KQT35637.1 hypothetical protein ASG22_01025 [Chryseobacterium sp. Leaf405]